MTLSHRILKEINNITTDWGWPIGPVCGERILDVIEKCLGKQIQMAERVNNNMETLEEAKMNYLGAMADLDDLVHHVNTFLAERMPKEVLRDYIQRSFPSFIVGRSYKDRDGVIYQYLGRNDIRNRQIFLSMADGSVSQNNMDGTFNNAPSRRDISSEEV